MSSTAAADTARPWSVATRLTVWYAAAGFALVSAASGYLYWGLYRSLDQEDDLFLADKVRAIRHDLARRPADPNALRHEVQENGADRDGGRFFVRVSARHEADALETPGMAAVLPPDAFPPVAGDDRVADYRTAAGRLFRLRTSADPDSGAVIHAAMDRTHDDELLAEYREHLAYALGASLVLAVVGGYGIARWGVRPLAAVVATSRRVGPDHLGERLAVTGLPAEVRDLAETFNRMLDRLEEAFARLGQFSADIAHELRHPVNNLRGAVEVALGRPRSPEEYREVLGSCLEECDRLARLIDGLLFLARAGNPKTGLVRTAVDAAAELQAVGAVFAAAAAEAGVRFEVEAAPGLTLHADRDLIQRAVGNLVSNALAHTPAGGSITLFADRDAGRVRLGVRDSGSGIAPDHLPYVFDRFYRADPARSSDHGRVGLGLAIVRGIAELHGGTVVAVSPPGQGTAVTMHFSTATQ